MATAAALLLVVAGCGDDDTASDLPAVEEEQVEDGSMEVDEDDVDDAIEAQEEAPTCEEQYAEGNVVTDEDVDAGCIDDDGSLWFGGAASTECTDGRILKWNDRAWWYEGEGVHPHAPGAAELVAPEAERTSCTG